jgi:hypothetical protein
VRNVAVLSALAVGNVTTTDIIFIFATGVLSVTVHDRE